MHNVSRLLLVAAALGALFGPGSALASSPFMPSVKLPQAIVGNDVSYPQCGHTLPTGQAFGIVGVNGGEAGNFNPCLKTELAWAEKSQSPLHGIPKVTLYANTGNPGDITPHVADWPASSNPLTDPYGICTGSDNAACAWQYGYQRAYADAATATAPDWWLDIETVNSWSASQLENRADLEGMVYAFTIAGSRIGVYSTPDWWAQILGTIPVTSSLHSLPDWLPGASTEAGARSTCHQAPFTRGATVAIAQYTQNALDYDVSCNGQ